MFFGFLIIDYGFEDKIQENFKIEIQWHNFTRFYCISKGFLKVF